jgi:hypothetical protein
MPNLDMFVRRRGGLYQVVVVSPGSAARARAFVEQSGTSTPVAPDQGLIAATYRVNVSPIAALLGTDGRIIQMTRPSSHAVPDLLARLSLDQPS